ncbi:glycosyltransferase family 2 protein [Niabella hibiscisoli]|uniref:glycosyltransferase family 2 protein n=1 Tax=Niabella hibiscisoli TaxID=1825928 RepID=UPI001F10E79F|nr:glycosyltransferase family 2 protein [Niabella hibiscisoli]MCH5717219.1 glycosyltransferase [Niabella hibiscisoli]
MPLISICIPAYQRVEYLDRLLQSIVNQEFKDFEVIVTDDSPDNSVQVLCEKYVNRITLTYHKNEVSLGTPANWNKAISLAQGSWIKLMHDDDWFTNAESLTQFADCAQKNEKGLIFSAYINFYESQQREEAIYPEKFRLLQADKEPAILVAKNFIGPPSVTMYKNDEKHEYDAQLKWLVDIDMYRRRMETEKLIYIAQPLVKVSLSNTQVTSYTKNIAAVEIPEHFHFLQKMGIEKLENILVYDYNWRFLRNFSIIHPKQFIAMGYIGNVHPVIKSMIYWQAKIPRSLLRNGFMSKIFMTLHFLFNKKNYIIDSLLYHHSQLQNSAIIKRLYQYDC